jgi:hypothetical protein
MGSPDRFEDRDDPCRRQTIITADALVVLSTGIDHAPLGSPELGTLSK